MSEATFLAAMSIICGTIGFVASTRVLNRFLERRAARGATLGDPHLHERLERIELAVETTAIEVERIAESTRFVAKLASERDRPAVGSRAFEPVITPH